MDFAHAFLEAVAANDLPRVQNLLGVDRLLATARDKQGRSALLIAAYHGHEELVVLLGSHIEILDLFEASVVGDVQRVREILEKSPTSLEGTSADGFHALGLAAFFGNAETVEQLLAMGADPNTPSANAMKVRALHSVLARPRSPGAIRIARMLLEGGADPNAQQDGGYAALHQAAMNGQAEVVDLLIEHGADREIQADDGRTAADFARERGRTAVVERLQED